MLKYLTYLLLSVLPFSLVQAGGINPAMSDPVIMQAMERVEVEVIGTTNGNNHSAVQQCKERIQASVEKRLREGGIVVISLNRSAEERPPHLAILFRITNEGPDHHNAHIWVELYDRVTHCRTGRTIKAQVWGINHVVVESSPSKCQQAMVNHAVQAIDRLIALHYQGKQSE